MSASKRYCFTWFVAADSPNFEPEDFSPPIQYMVWQGEICPTTNRYHLQGYLECDPPKRMTALVKLMPGCSFRKAKGNEASNTAYCTKETSRAPGEGHGPFFFGEPSAGQGHRSDLDACRVAINEGASDLTLWEDHFSTMVRYNRSMKMYKRIKTAKRNWVMEVLILWGPPDTGKTRWAYHHFPDLYSLPQAKTSGTYWTDYDGEETVLIDEMYGNRMSFGFLLQLCDRYAFKVPQIGTSAEFVSRRIIMTSNAAPTTWYNVPNYAAFRRRITKVTHFRVQWTPPEDEGDGVPPSQELASDEDDPHAWLEDRDDYDEDLPLVSSVLSPDANGILFANSE